MLRSICCDEEDDILNCLDLETVICKVYFPQMGEDGHAKTLWPTSSYERRQQNKEIRRFHINNSKSFNQFFDLVTSNIAEPSTEITLMVLDADMDWIPVVSEEQWVTLLTNARTMTNNKPKQLRIKVSGKNGSCVTPIAAASTKKRTTSSRKNSSCCIIPTKVEEYPRIDSSNFLSIKQDFGTLQKQMEAMKLEQQEKKKKKKVNSDKKKQRSSKNVDIVNQIAYHSEIFNNWCPSKWKSDSSASITVL